MSTTLSTTPATLALEQDDVECPICYVDTSTSSAGIVLTTCQHLVCTPCLIRWIEKEEASGQEAPACPICRVQIDEDDVCQIIGRPFAPRELGSEESNSEEIDEFTLHWLNENTVLCQGCGSRIEKESGCDLIECLCGYRFCYKCNAPGGRCDCNRGHGFLGLEWGSLEEYIIQPVRDENGFVDIKSCIEQRRWKQEGERVRNNRYYRRHEQWEESEMFWRRGMKPCKAMELCHGRWIFSCKTNRASAQMLTNMFEAIEKDSTSSEMGNWIRDPSTGRWSQVTPSDGSVSSNWLFLQKGADLQALEQLQNRHDVQFLRRWYRCRTCDWELYCSLKIWHRLFDGMEVRRRRCEMRAANENVPFDNGAWLFS